MPVKGTGIRRESNDAMRKKTNVSPNGIFGDQWNVQVRISKGGGKIYEAEICFCVYDFYAGGGQPMGGKYAGQSQNTFF